MEKENILIRSNGNIDGINEELVKLLNSRRSEVNVLIYEWNHLNINSAYNVKYYRARPLYTHDCLELNENTMPIDGKLLESMLPYKDMAMELMKRETHYDVYERKYLEDVYYKQVKYWNTTIEKNSINSIIFMVSPHLCGDYILYALAKVKGINMVLVYPQLMNKGNGSFLGKSLENIGDSIQKAYTNIKGEPTINEYMMGIYNNALSTKVMSYKSPKALQKETIKMFHNATGNKVVLNDIKRIIKIKLNYLKMNDKKGSLLYYKRLLYTRLKARRYEHRMDHLDIYQKLCEFPRKDEKYVYFPLQMEPESSLIPLAGAFKNQLIALEMLSYYSEKYNYKIYVKEHYVQINRSPGFYEKLKALKNVCLIDMNQNSLELIRGSFCVASQTGNCLLEALINEKPAIAFGSGYTFKGAPNIINVISLSELDEALERIDNNSVIFDSNDVKRYLYAIQKEMVYSYVDSLDEAYKDYNKCDTVERIVNYLFDGANNY